MKYLRLLSLLNGLMLSNNVVAITPAELSYLMPHSLHTPCINLEEKNA